MEESLADVPGYEDVTLTLDATWHDDPKFEEHVDMAEKFLMSGGRCIGEKAGVSQDYLRRLFRNVFEVRLCMSVWARKDGEEEMVLALVCKDLEPVYALRMSDADLDGRLFLAVVCGRYPKAMGFAMTMLSIWAIERGYTGVSLTASNLHNAATFSKYGFKISANACAGTPQPRLYRDRVQQFACGDMPCDEEDVDTWAAGLISFGAAVGQSKDSATVVEEYSADQLSEFPFGDGIFMDMCLEV
jgi:hypothetical protein